MIIYKMDFYFRRKSDGLSDMSTYLYHTEGIDRYNINHTLKDDDRENIIKLSPDLYAPKKYIAEVMPSIKEILYSYLIDETKEYDSEEAVDIAYKNNDILLHCFLTVMDESSYTNAMQIYNMERNYHGEEELNHEMYNHPELCTAHVYQYLANIDKIIDTKYEHGLIHYGFDINKWINIPHMISLLQPGTIVTLQDFKNINYNMETYQGIVLVNKRRGNLPQEFNKIQIICLDTDRFFDVVLDDVADHIVRIDGYDYDKLVSVIKSWGGESDPEEWILMINEPYV